MRKLAAIFISLLLAAQTAVTAFAASPYGVVVQSGKACFYQNGYLTASYAMSGKDISLTTDEEGDLLVCFYNAANQFTGITLGDQPSVTISGSIDRLQLNKDLNRNVVLNSACKVSKLDVYAPVDVTIYGQVDTLTATNKSKVTASVNADIGQRSVVSGAEYVQNGSGSKGTSSSKDVMVTKSNRITFRALEMEAEYKDTLRDIEDDLENHVKAYDSNGTRIYGDFEWDDSRSTTLRRNGTYEFRFDPDSSRYTTAYGKVRVVVDDDDDYDRDGDDIELEIDSFEVDDDDGTLEDYEDELEDSVEAFNDDDDEVRGRVEWVDEDERVRRTGWYKFRFIPSSSRYEVVRSEIKIYVDGDRDDDDIELEIDDMEIDEDDYSGTIRLEDIEDELEDYITAYDEDDDEIDGEFEWVSNGETKVKDGKEYKFRFIPDDKDYRRVTDYITVYLND
ncbi:MAG: hypothetical protein IKV41_06615 [Oscillospiraceae bacterium]|nr:hypothetical protein [Oscillospiraceae bacterium]